MAYKVLEEEQLTVFQALERVSESAYWKNICTEFNIPKLSRSDICRTCHHLKIHTESPEI
jgi:hypothetical protein